MSSPLEDLFAEVYANPDDDQIRRVLADALLAVNDPRGELILFQLEPDKDHQRRAMRLIQAHGLSWLVELRGKVIPLSYERGFLASAQLLSGVGPIDFDHRIWSTVHTIDVGGLRDAEVAAFRITPVMRSLAVVSGLSPHRRGLIRGRAPAHVQLMLDGSSELVAEPYDPANE